MTFSLAFIRAVVLDIRDIQGDRILGKETIPIAIGKERTKTILTIITALTAVLLAVSPFFGWTTSLGYYLLPCVAYAFGYQYLFQKRIVSEALDCWRLLPTSTLYLPELLFLFGNPVIFEGLTLL